MKTTVEIPDAVLKEARRVATQEKTNVRALIVDGLRGVLAERKRKGTFRLRKASFKGSGPPPPGRPPGGEDPGHDLREPRRVIAVDTNLLVYAHREDSPWHEAAAARM